MVKKRTVKKPRKSRAALFCVIGDKSTAQIPINRSWFATQEEAADHAASLLSKHTSSVRGLFVVQVVSMMARVTPVVQKTTIEPAYYQRLLSGNKY